MGTLQKTPVARRQVELYDRSDSGAAGVEKNQEASDQLDGRTRLGGALMPYRHTKRFTFTLGIKSTCKATAQFFSGSPAAGHGTC